MKRVEQITFDENSMRKIGNVKEALAIFQKQGYGYKAIVKKFFEAYEINDGRGNTFSIAPYVNVSDFNTFYENLPTNFKQLLPIEVVEKQNKLFKELLEVSKKENKPLKEVAKDYFKPKKREDEILDPKEPIFSDKDVATKA